MSEPPVHIAPDDMHAHPHHTGRPKLDLIIALSAIFMSAMSLLIGLEHGRAERDMVAASTWPFVGAVIMNDANGGQDAEIGIINSGVGPAKLKTLEVFYDGHPVSSSFDLLRQCCGLASDRATIRQQIPQGLLTSVVDETVLRPGEMDAVLEVPRVAAAPGVPKEFIANLLKISFKGCYCSVLDECWVSDLSSTRTQKVPECPVPAQRFDPNGP